MRRKRTYGLGVRVKEPALSGAKGQARRGAKKPALSRVKGPALSGAKGLALSRAKGYHVSRAAPRLRWRATGITRSQVLALLLVLGMVALLAWFFTDTSFFVYEVDVQGNALLSATEIYKASGLNTMSIFFVDQAQVAERIREAIPGVTTVRVDCEWPARVRIHIREQDVKLVWHTQGAAYLVDGEGRVLKANDASLAGMSESRRAGLLSIRDADDQPLKPGDQVARAALNAASGLHRLLPEVTAFEYSRAKGVYIVDGHGWRIYFGDDQALEKKVACMRTLLQRILSAGASVEFIDVRFPDSPYYK